MVLSFTARPRYGVDGWPYLLGLSAAALALLPTGAALLARGRVGSGAVAVGAGLAAAVPAGLGARYVLVGKAQLRDRLLNAVEWRGDEDVVDLGCGSGLLGLSAAQRTSGTVHAVDLWVGKDLSGNGESRLRRNAELLGVASRVIVHTADVRGTGLADASADVVLSALCFHNLGATHHRAAALTEAVRVLRPGGTLVISDLAHIEDEYAPLLRQQGLLVRTESAPGTFPPQRYLVASRSG